MENILLLHGALGSAATLAPLQTALQSNYSVHVLDFSGHGGLPMPEAFSMQLFAQDMMHYLDQHGINRTHIFGYSMGGYAALYFALQHPERVSSIFTLATKFAWSPEAAEKEAKMLNPEKIIEKVPQFAEALRSRHAPQDWKQVMHQTARMMQQLGAAPVLTPENLQQITAPVRVSVGDRDGMVSIDETAWAYKLMPKASLLVLPDTRHPLETVSVSRLATEINEFTALQPQKASL